MTRRGRRPGPSTTRADILDAARRTFSIHGFGGATVRAIADDAGVDPALIHHYFGTKQALFAATMDLPFEPEALVDRITEVPREQTGVRLVEVFLHTWDEPASRQLMNAVLRSVASHDQTQPLLRDFLVTSVYRPVVVRLGSDEPDRRAALAFAQIIGLAHSRYLLGIEPLAGEPADEVAAALGPAVQHVLTGPFERLPR